MWAVAQSPPSLPTSAAVNEGRVMLFVRYRQTLSPFAFARTFFRILKKTPRLESSARFKGTAAVVVRRSPTGRLNPLLETEKSERKWTQFQIAIAMPLSFRTVALWPIRSVDHWLYFSMCYIGTFNEQLGMAVGLVWLYAFLGNFSLNILIPLMLEWKLTKGKLRCILTAKSVNTLGWIRIWTSSNLI